MNQHLNHIHLERPLVVLDLESTGVDPTTDRIVEIAMLKLLPNGKRQFYGRRVDPQTAIPLGATLVHGITDSDVCNAPPFSEIAQEVCAWLKGCDLAGFGIVHFDLPLLGHELARTGCRFQVRGRCIIDALDIYRRMEPRDLSSAVRYYLGREHTHAHSATADVRATLAVLDQQIAHYALPSSPDALHAYLIDVDIARRFRRDEAGQICFNFGKHVGKRLTEVAEHDSGYLSWMLHQSFLDDVRVLVRRALAGKPLELPV